VTDEEFMADRDRLELERRRIEEQLGAGDGEARRFELVADVISFRSRAAVWFSQAGDPEKRQIFSLVGSNPTLKAGILSVEASKPFFRVSGSASLLAMCATVEDVRTPCPEKWKSFVWKFIRQTAEALADQEVAELRGRLHALSRHFDEPFFQEAAELRLTSSTSPRPRRPLPGEAVAG